MSAAADFDREALAQRQRDHAGRFRRFDHGVGARAIECFANHVHFCIGHHQWLAIESEVDPDFDPAELDAKFLRPVATIVAETAAEREGKKLAAIEAEAHAAGAAFGTVDHKRVRSGLPRGGFGAGYVAEFDDGGFHGSDLDRF